MDNNIKYTIVIIVILLLSVLAYHIYNKQPVVTTTSPSSATTSPSSATTPPSSATTPPSSATTSPSSATTPVSTVGTEHFGPRKGILKKQKQKKSANDGFRIFTEKDLERLTTSPDITDIGATPEYDPASMSVDAEVYASHQAFVDNTYLTSTGASGENSVRSDAQDINPRVGLRRVDYTTAYSGDDSRQVSSQTPDQLDQGKGYGYCL